MCDNEFMVLSETLQNRTEDEVLCGWCVAGCACKVMNLWSSLNVVSSTKQFKDASRGYTHHERSFENAHVANTQGSMTGFEVTKLDFANVRRSFGGEQVAKYIDFLKISESDQKREQRLQASQTPP